MIMMRNILFLQGDYQTIPEEYTDMKETKHYPKLPSITTVAEYDVVNDNHEMTKDADHLLRIMANPDLFRTPERDISKIKGRQGTRDSITALVTGMLIVSGSVAVTASNEHKNHNDNKEETDQSETVSDTRNIKRQKSVSLPHCGNTGVQNQRQYKPVKKISAPPTYTGHRESGDIKQNNQIRKHTSFAGFSVGYNLPDIQED